MIIPCSLLFNLDNTAIIGIALPSSSFADRLAKSRPLTKTGTWATTNPVGTGPFKLNSWRTVKQTYKKFNYWVKMLRVNNYLTSMDKWFYSRITVMQAAYLNKEIDLIYIVSPFHKDLKAQMLI
jgi:ABC-type transport system substrate-binding protein